MGKKSKRRAGKVKSRQLPPAAVAAANRLVVAGGNSNNNNNVENFDIRVAMDDCILAVNSESDNKNSPRRMNCFYTYTMFMKINLEEAEGPYNGNLETPITEADKRFLRGIIRDNTEPAFFRALALGLMGRFYMHCEGDGDEFCFCLQNVVAVCRAATDREKMQLVPFHNRMFEDEAPNKTVGDILQEEQTNAQKALTTVPDMYHCCKWDAERNDVVDVDPIPGNTCDGCGILKKADENLLVCSRCKVTYYCSEKCQKAHWKKQHKKMCREKGQFCVGDHARALKPFGSAHVGAEIIIRAVQEEYARDDPGAPKQGKWFVGRGDIESEAVLRREDDTAIVVQKKSSFPGNASTTAHHPDGTPRRFLVAYEEGEGATEMAILAAEELRNIRPTIWGVNSKKLISFLVAAVKSRDAADAADVEDDDDDHRFDDYEIVRPYRGA